VDSNLKLTSFWLTLIRFNRFGLEMISKLGVLSNELECVQEIWVELRLSLGIFTHKYVGPLPSPH
jgi:hypothetical protein